MLFLGVSKLYTLISFCGIEDCRLFNSIYYPSSTYLLHACLFKTTNITSHALLIIEHFLITSLLLYIYSSNNNLFLPIHTPLISSPTKHKFVVQLLKLFRSKLNILGQSLSLKKLLLGVLSANRFCRFENPMKNK